MTHEPLTSGVHHIGLTVPNVEETARFFCDVLHFNIVGKRDDYPAIFVSDGNVMLTLWQVNEPDSVAPFNRKQTVGLHHLALRIGDLGSLMSLHAALEGAPGVSIEFAPEPLRGGPVQHMMCAIPGGIRVEFIAA